MVRDAMLRALELAARARGWTGPNPMVGAVLVRHGEVVGEGYHPGAGRPHAEVFALSQAGDRARGATLYVNLEPCCHFGRTPPCTRALLEAGVAEVRMAMLDPDPRVAGRGRRELERAGVRTCVGEREREARLLNEVFLHRLRRGRPFVTAKFAMSLDGKIAAATGDSRWITGPEARRRVHRERHAADAVLVGAGTVLADDPRLTTRLDGGEGRHPLRVVLDSRGRVPLTARIFRGDLPGRTLVATTAAMAPPRRRALRDRGVEVLVLPRREGRVDLEALVGELARRGVGSLLVEGGGTVLAGFFGARLVDKVMAFVAPLVVGGRDAPTPVEGAGVPRIAEALRLEEVEVERLGGDLLVTGYPGGLP